ncbi:MAG: sigma-54 dependent transcriptional regulator [Myxococcota bacterium]
MAKSPLESMSLLVVEDDSDLALSIAAVMATAGIKVEIASTFAAAESWVGRSKFDVALVDWFLPDGEAPEFIRRARLKDETLQFVVMTSQNSVDRAVDAIKAGAEQFLIKPLDFEALQIVLQRMVEKSNESRSAAAAVEEDIDPFGSQVADIERSRCAQIAAQSGNVIISGETGSGKGVLARWIHVESGRRGPFVSLNCAGLNPELLESELFGHERGAFTGANQRKQGLFELARGGTLFLDELGELPRVSQAKILKAVEEGRFRRLGGTQEITTDARLIGASHADLSDPEVLRPDLFYRLATYRVTIRPLRERREAIDAITRSIVRALRPGTQIAPDAMAALRTHRWPGNIRELRNVLERSVSLLRGNQLTRDDLDMLNVSSGSVEPGAEFGLELTLAEVEAAHVARVLRHHGGNMSQAAKSLGISRTTLYKKLAQHDSANTP